MISMQYKEKQSDVVNEVPSLLHRESKETNTYTNISATVIRLGIDTLIKRAVRVLHLRLPGLGAPTGSKPGVCQHASTPTVNWLLTGTEISLVLEFC